VLSGRFWSAFLKPSNVLCLVLLSASGVSRKSQTRTKSAPTLPAATASKYATAIAKDRILNARYTFLRIPGMPTVS
jgi:hypothetical protein